jgi:S-DNA-T family DNA segregation ATPase FtsK/SpoIIIE
VLQDGPAVGVYALCADEQERFLPEACGATAVFSPDDAAYLDLRRSGADPVLDVLAEPVTPALAETAARALAPLRDVSAEEDDAVLPDTSRLLDVLAMPDPDVDAIRARWQHDGRSTRVVIGAGLDGPFSLDLRTDGPHGLIAGTTGSGKSELLQTMIASLAVANRPDALNFVLVDYKGGSAFKDCVALPHTVGMVTDLDAHLVERALTSLGAELTFREHWLAGAGVKDIEDYQDLQQREPGRASLPRLLLVIDEFASMARELPDFVTGLVNIAQRGRSLGIHLLLATQRPSGVVSPEIRANTNLRISLRVTDAADSSDVLEATDAARIPKSAPGRGYARLGHGGLVPFQAGRVGGRRPGVRPTIAPVPFVTPTGWQQLGYAAPGKPASAQVVGDTITDLSVLVEALSTAAEGMATQRSPWLEALPERVLADALDDGHRSIDGVVAPLPFGLEDLPAVQQQRVVSFDPATDGHLLVIGSARSGRSQLLRTLAAAVAQRCSSADVHLFGLDCGNGALMPLQDLPHCGAVVTRTQVERVLRLLGRLSAELERRQALLSESGFADITEQRRVADPADRLPHLLLLLDRWEGFISSLGDVDGGRLTDIVLVLLREGASVGISLVITGDRSLASGRISSLCDNKLVLRLADRGDYSLCGLNPRQLPELIPPGRGFEAGTGAPTQVALLSDDDSGQGQAAVLAELATAAAMRDAQVPRSARPFRVDVLPSRLSFEQAWEMRPKDAGSLFALVGVGGDELSGVGPDLAVSGPAFVVGGPGRAGKSSLLVVLARSLLRAGTHVVIGAPRPSPLRELAGEPGVLAVVTDAAAPASDYADALTAAGDAPVVLLLDDAEVLRDCPAAELFRDVAKGMAGPGRSLVLAGNAEGICTGLSGWQVEAKKSRQGVLLSPQGGGDGDLIGLRLPRSGVGQAVQPGRGVLHLGDSTLLSIAVPTP